MADAFDRWIEWANNPPGQRPGLSSDVHASVMSLDREDRTDRQKVNGAVQHRAELRRTGRTAWIYLDDFDRGTQRTVGDPEWVKIFASAEAADRWFDKHDPEGVAWEYEIDGGPGKRLSGSSSPTKAPDKSATRPGSSCSPRKRPPRNGLSRTLRAASLGNIRSRSET